MNSSAPVAGSAAPMQGIPPWGSRRVGARVAIALLLSIAVHVLVVGGALIGWWSLPSWTGISEPPPVVHARLVTPPAPPPVVEAAPPAESKAPPAPASAPRRPRIAPAAPPVMTAEAGPPVASEPAAVTASPAAGNMAAANAPRGVDVAPAPAAAPVPGPPARSALPARARLYYEISSEANNMRLSAVQTWDMKDGRYRTRIGGKFGAFGKIFVSIDAESAGTVTAQGLRMDQYSYARNDKHSAVNVAPDFKSAAIDEMSGNHKTVPLVGQPVNLANLAYHLAFVPDLPVGSKLAFFNRDELEEVQLVDKRDEMISLDSINVQTRYYEFRRADGSGGAQIWLATDHQWLPAKMRVAARDGVLVFTVTRWDLNPSD